MGSLGGSASYVPDPVSIQAQNQIDREDYAGALETLRPLLESPEAWKAAKSAVLCHVGLGQYAQARRVIRELYPPWTGGPGGEYSSDAGRQDEEVWGFVLAKSGECPPEVWAYFENGDDFRSFGKVAEHTSKDDARRQLLPAGPSPRALDFMASFHMGTLLGPRATERIYREALALWPEHPGARMRLAGLMAARVGFRTEPDGTPAKTKWDYGTPAEEIHQYVNSTVFHITDDAGAREILAHYRIAQQNAPEIPSLRRELKGRVFMWEYNLGMHR